MSVPLSGLIVIIVTIWFIVMRPNDLVILAVVLNAFGAASVINLGGGDFPVGVAPYYFIATLIAIRILPCWIFGRIRFFSEEPAAMFARTMAIFVIVCVGSAFLFPNLFSGLPVDVPRAGVARHNTIPQAPLHWSFSNAGQAAYMILNFFVILEFLKRCESRGFPRRLAKAFTWSGLLAAAVGFFQVTCPHVGLTFPAWLFNSNNAWGENPNQMLAGGFSRMSATFVEPSDAGRFFACWVVFELTLAISSTYEERWHWFCAILGTAALFLTTSSTGYVIAAISWFAVVWQTASMLLKTGKIHIRKTVAILGVVVGIAVVLLAIPGVWDMLNAVLFEKQGSESAVDRGATLGRAIQVFLATWGLGAGLGSNRAMSVAFYLISNVGVLGTALFVYMFARVYLMARSAGRSSDTAPALRAVVRASVMALSAYFVGMLVSGAEITAPEIWLLLGMILAGFRQTWLIEHDVFNLLGRTPARQAVI